MNVYLVRHAASLRSKIGIWGRLFDAELDPERLFQLDPTKAALADLPNKVLFSSPLARCVQSARHIFGPAETIVNVPELRAYHSGILEEKDEAYVRKHYPGYVDASFKERFVRPQFGEESIAAQAQRVKKGLIRVLAAEFENVVVVTHYSVINIIGGLAVSESDPAVFAEGRIDVGEGGFIRRAVDRADLLAAISHEPATVPSWDNGIIAAAGGGEE